MKFEELDPNARILLLSWMREGLTAGIKNSVMTRTYQLFLKTRGPDHIGSSGAEFSPADFFQNLMKPHEKAHFIRIADSIEIIENLMDEAERKLDERDDDESTDVDESLYGIRRDPDIDLDGPIPGFDGGNEQ